VSITCFQQGGLSRNGCSTFGQVGFHPLALTRGEYDDGKGCMTVRFRRLLECPVPLKLTRCAASFRAGGPLRLPGTKIRGDRASYGGDRKKTSVLRRPFDGPELAIARAVLACASEISTLSVRSRTASSGVFRRPVPRLRPDRSGRAAVSASLGQRFAEFRASRRDIE